MSSISLLPTPGHTPGHLSIALEDGDTVFLFAADASYTQQLVRRRPTLYLPSHDPGAVARLVNEVAA